MTKKIYTGLSDAEVLESRQKFGANILSPVETETMWEKIKNCMYFWLLKVDLVILIITILLAFGLPLFYRQFYLCLHTSLPILVVNGTKKKNRLI